MTHAERLELLLAYQAGSLDEPQAAEVRALLASGDPATVGAAAEAREVLARLAATAAPVPPRPALKNKLLAGLPSRDAGTASATPRLRLVSDAAPASPRDSSSLRIGPADDRSDKWRAYRVAAAALVFFGIAGYVVSRLAERNLLQAQLELTQQQISARDGRIAELEKSLASAGTSDPLARDMIEAMYSPEARIGVVNAAVGDTTRRRGRVVVDPQRKQVQVFVFDLEPPPPGRTYQLWLLPADGGAPVPATIFKVEASGRATVAAAVPGAMNIAGAAISEEATGGSVTGKPDVLKLVGKAG
jgi:anti-sigma-K factor RskA